MTDQNGTSTDGAKGTPSLELVYALAPLYCRLLAAGVAQLRMEYYMHEGIGEVSCEARNAFGQDVSSRLNDELKKAVVGFVLLLVDHRYPDWSRGAGACGRIEWNLTRNDLLHKHHRRTVTLTTTEHRGL